MLWERFLKKWYSSHPEEEAGATHGPEIMRLIKDNIDPHYVWWKSGYKQHSAFRKNAIRLRALGEDVSLTKTQRTVMNAAYPRDLRLKFPDHREVMWEDKDGDLVDEEGIRKFFKTNKIHWDEEHTPTYNGPKSSVGIGMTPDDENWSDHGHDHRLKTFPQDLREGKQHERRGFTKAGKLMGTPKAKPPRRLPRRRK